MRSKKNRIIAGLTLAAAIFSMTGCESTPKDERSAGRALDDKNITQSIKKKLEGEPAYKFNGVNVTTFAGIVQLNGFVNTEDQKNRAQEIAQRTDGVREVVNGISLKPAMPTTTGRTNAPTKIYSEPNGPTTEPVQENKPNQSTEPK